jgi:hypothetical protein
MPLDSDPIISSRRPDDFSGILLDGLSGVQYKLVFFLLLIFLMITSDVFTNRVLSKFKGAVDYKNATNYGTFLQGIFLCLFFIIVDMGIKQKVI